jgi:hypothetical protein
MGKGIWFFTKPDTIPERGASGVLQTLKRLGKVEFDPCNP